MNLASIPRSPKGRGTALPEPRPGGPANGWERPARLVRRLDREFDSEAFARFLSDLGVNLKSTKPENQAVELVRHFAEKNDLDGLENAMDRARTLRRLPRSLPTPQPKPILIFVSYSHSDSKLIAEILNDLENLKDDGLIETWYDGKILAGDEFDEEIHRNLDVAHIILLSISRAFLNSSYVKQRELPRAMERHEAGEARVIPVLLKPSPWKLPPWSKFIGGLEVLPKGEKPVVNWRQRDDAFVDVFKRIREVVLDMCGRLEDADGNGANGANGNGRVSGEPRG
jgi:hypothetical protein